jgi:hypothetical protein
VSATDGVKCEPVSPVAHCDAAREQQRVGLLLRAGRVVVGTRRSVPIYSPL